jgi:Na+/melibiose symporter-like transporter
MIWALNNHGPKYSIVVGSGIILAGSWIRYVAAHITSGRYAVALTGQIVTGISQPFVLAVSTRYNKLWFSDKGQIAAVAAVSLANPLGGAIGEFLSPLIADNASGLPNLLLYTAVVSTVVTLPAPFIPKAPPSPPSATATVEFRHFRAAIRSLSQNKAFLLLIVAFWVYVGLFDMTSSIFGQILIPYGFSQTEAGIAGAAEIFGGVVISAIVSPILDRTKAFKFAVRLLIPIIAICYTILIFLPGFRSAAGLYTVCVVLGGASFSLMPMVLELLTQVTHPISPEISSIIAWIGGGTLGGILIIVSNALETSSGWNGQPEGSMIKGLILQAVLAWAALPAALIVVSMKPNGRSIF